MKKALLSCCILLLSFTARDPKFSYLVKSKPVYIAVKGLKNGEDDSISGFIKDTLRKAGFTLLSSEESTAYMKDFGQKVTSNSKLNNPANSRSREDYFEKLYAGILPIQLLTIFYINGKDTSGSAGSFDEIGFKYMAVPGSYPPENTSISFPAKKIGSVSADSVARFLLKKL